VLIFLFLSLINANDIIKLNAGKHIAHAASICLGLNIAAKMLTSSKEVMLIQQRLI
jgi:hypothetical protein